jgi:hypothetical protein
MTRTDDNSDSSSGRVGNRCLKKTDSHKENEGTTKRGRSLTGKVTEGPSILASRSALAPYQRSATITKPPSAVPQPAYPLYNYADNIPRPKVIYIKKKEQANEMVASLNGQVSLSQPVFAIA